MSDLLLLAVEEPLWKRLAVCIVAVGIGSLLIFAGIGNIKSRSAEESGKRRLVNKAMGRSNTYEGSTAVAIGWVRILCGIGVIIFGIVFVFVGPFLAN